MLNVFIICEENDLSLCTLTSNNMSIFKLKCKSIKNLCYKKLIIVSNIKNEHKIKKQLNEMNISNYFLIAEPIKKNIAQVLALACIIISNPTSEILILGSDHILDNNNLYDSVIKGRELIDENIIFFGIKVNNIDTSYNYINYSDNDIIKFIDNVNNDESIKYVSNDSYLLNSNNFLFLSGIMQYHFRTYENNMYLDLINCVYNSIIDDKVLYINKNEFNKINLTDLSIKKCKNKKIVKY